jgi:hypothetical protein
MNTAGRAILFAGATVVIALLGMFALGGSGLERNPSIRVNVSFLLWAHVFDARCHCPRSCFSLLAILCVGGCCASSRGVTVAFGS